jgi:hypothetical protein
MKNQKYSLTEQGGTFQLGREILAADCTEDSATSHGEVTFRRGSTFVIKRWISVFGCSDSYDLLSHSANQEGFRIVDFSSQAL